jgi:hypothetical protein
MFNSPKAPNGSGSAAVKGLLVILAALAIAGSSYGTYVWQHRKLDQQDKRVAELTTDLAAVPVYDYTSTNGVKIKVFKPIAKSAVSTPLIVMGEVPGNWSFEASFPVKLLDAKGNQVAQVAAQLQGDWMTDKLVPFTAKLSFKDVTPGSGTLVLQKDNPSGLPANDDSLSIPVSF